MTPSGTPRPERAARPQRVPAVPSAPTHRSPARFRGAPRALNAFVAAPPLRSLRRAAPRVTSRAGTPRDAARAPRPFPPASTRAAFRLGREVTSRRARAAGSATNRAAAYAASGDQWSGGSGLRPPGSAATRRSARPIGALRAVTGGGCGPWGGAGGGRCRRGGAREHGEDVRLSVQAAAHRRLGCGEDVRALPLLRGCLQRHLHLHHRCAGPSGAAAPAGGAAELCGAGRLAPCGAEPRPEARLPGRPPLAFLVGRRRSRSGGTRGKTLFGSL